MKGTSNINMDGLEVNREIIKAFKNFKQGSLLESNYLQVRHEISRDKLEHYPGLDVEEITKRKMIQNLSSTLVEKYKDSFEKTETSYGTQFSLAILAMSTSELKHIVEYCIRTMPQEAIEEIRK